MKIAAISDTHGRSFTVPPCDVFIHAGDFTGKGTYGQNSFFAYWLEKQTQAKHIILVPGNHDKLFQVDTESAIKMYGFAHVLIDEGVIIEGKTFWGSPWTPPFFNWSFMAEESQLAKTYESIPKTIDVLITHGPPYGILDPGHDGSHAGSKALLLAVERTKPHHHVFGHLHADGGLSEILVTGVAESGTSTILHNIAAVDEVYNLVRGCLEFEI